MHNLQAALVTIGDELLIGQTIDTNSAVMAQMLNAHGIWVRRRYTVGDLPEDMTAALDAAAADCSVIIMTGGLGPTADDITKPVLCRYFGCGLRRDKDTENWVRKIFERLGRPITERNLQQADVPEACTVLPNGRGTAPGMLFERNGKVFISLPGVPYEMKGLMEMEVLPRLLHIFHPPAIEHRTLLTAGQGESFIADRLTAFESALPLHIKLAYLPAYGMVRLRLTARGPEKEALKGEIDALFAELKELVRPWMVADRDLPMAAVVKETLEAVGGTLAVAESCTGGYISHLLTSLPGSSRIFMGGAVAYANGLKMELLGVPQEVLEAHGAVSEQTALAMAEGVRRRSGADYGLATTGIMGPDGGSEEKPVGTVWMAVCGPAGTRAVKHQLRFDRARNIEQAALTALNFLRAFIEEGKGH